MNDPFQLSATAASWVDETLQRLNLDRRIGQIINITIGWGIQDEAKFLDLVEQYQPGSGQGGTGTWQECHRILEKINARLDIPLCTSTDAESGVNVIGATPFPSGMGRAAIPDLELAEEQAYLTGKTTALQARAIGLFWNLAPVVDINANFRNPITNIRSAGDNLERVQRVTAAYIQGLQDHGMAACAKHFPGDGYSDLDQHKLTTVNPLSREQWFAQSGAAFQHAIDAGVLTIMPGHIACPALDPTTNERGRPLPATLSRVLLTDILRGELGFTGLIVSDALGMGGVLEHLTTKQEAVVRGLHAGFDVALMIGHDELQDTFDAIHRALDEGTLTESLIEEKARRMLSLKARLGLHELETAIPPLEEARTLFQPRLNEQEALAMADQTITKVMDIENILPLDARALKRVRVNVLNEEQFWGDDNIKLFGNTIEKLQFVDELKARGLEVDVFEDPGEYSTYRTMDQYDAIFYLFNNGPQASRCSIAPCRQALRDIDWRVINSNLPVIFVALRSPYLPFYLPGIPNCICTYANSDTQQTALAKAIFGEIPFRGALPVAMPQEKDSAAHLL